VEGLVKEFSVQRSWTDIVRRPFRRPTVRALRGVSLEIADGEFFGLLGPNGAGKTTIFKVLATLVLPDAGNVRVADRDVTEDPSTVREFLTPVIADERSLDWRLSGYENLRLFAGLYGLPRAEWEGSIRELLRRVGLEDAAKRMVGTYSSGMKQRLLIARALLSRPRVLLLDEPTRSLDPVSARNFRRFLREEIGERYGCTVLLATHDADEAFELCDRLAVLDEGRVVARGTVGELARQADDHRLRVVVPTDRAEEAVQVVRRAGVESVHRLAAEDEGWTALSGQLRGGPEAGARLSAALSEHGIPVAEVARDPLPLADLIDRLVRRVGAP
jgi:ABC-2 type transport system ATP-binding protein